MYRVFAKRLFDLALTVPALVVLLPLFAVVGLLVRLKLGSPVFFCQRRPGLHGKPFMLIKFRTMTDGRDAQGKLLPDADRLTPFGRFLRQTSLDELPALWNILVGDMSLVGPRPLLMEYLERYTPAQAHRHDVRPGITGLAQVHGRNAIPFSQRLHYDLEYVDTYSFWLDGKILLLTAYRVGFGKLFDGAGQDVAVVDDLKLHPDSRASTGSPATGGQEAR